MKQFSTLLLAASIFGLSACSSNPFSSADTATPMNNSPNKIITVATSTETVTTTTAASTIGGHMAVAMDGNDKSKMSHALDKALGKSTTWTNHMTDITYTVTPIEKVTINNNSFCRKYTFKAVKHGSEQSATRTACVGADANWQEI